MQIAVFFNPNDPNDVREAGGFISRTLDSLSPAPAGLRQSVQEILALGSGEFLRAAYEHFGSGRFTLADLAARTGRDVPSLHSSTANLGRASDHRNVELFDRHGGQPTELSIREDVVRVLGELLG